MLFRALTATAASLALLSTTAALAAQPTQPSASASRLSLSNAQRAGAPVSEDSSQLTGGAGGIVAIALGLGIASILVIDLVINDDDEDPASP